MKKILNFICFCLVLNGLEAQIATPAASPTASVMQQIGLVNVTINYGRPSLKGRKMIGSASIPYGKVWRTGANKVTSIELSDDVLINDKPVAKGKYALVTIPDKLEWTVILNKESEQWGTYNYKESADIMRFKVKPTILSVPTETLTVEFENTKPSSANVAIRWEKTKIKFKISHDPHAKILADIKAKTADPQKITNDTYYDAANYYLNNNVDLKQALEWATALVAKDPQSWNYALQGSIAAKLGQCELAVEAATKGYALAEKEKDGVEMANNKKVLQACKKK